MTTYYLEVRMTKSSGQYWTIGLKFDAGSFRGAINLLDMWSFGIESVSSLTPYLLSINGKAAPERSYFSTDSVKEIREELATFMRAPLLILAHYSRFDFVAFSLTDYPPSLRFDH